MSHFRLGSSASSADASLKSALHRWDRAEGHAVLWFSEMEERKLYLNLGFSSIHQYASEALGFSSNTATLSLLAANSTAAVIPAGPMPTTTTGRR